MKRSKKRNPAKEPFASPISDEERVALVRKAMVGILDEGDEKLFQLELSRATGKMMSAMRQLGGNLQEEIEHLDAQKSASSATGSMVAMLPGALSLLAAGAATRRNASKAGRTRHDKFSEEAARRDGWEKLRTEILRECPGGDALSVRKLAKLIASRDPDGPPWESVRSYLKARSKRVGQHRL